MEAIVVGTLLLLFSVTLINKAIDLTQHTFSYKVGITI